MGITASDRGSYKSVTVTDTAANGGRVSRTPIISGALRNLFDYVSAAERTAGVTKYRKEFARITKAGLPAETALDMMAYLLAPSTAGDRKAIALGTDVDVFSDLDVDDMAWAGPGKLNAGLSGGETSLAVETEGGDIDFPPGSTIWIGDPFKASQTVDADVSVGSSVAWDTDHWELATYDDDYVHPAGLFLGDGLVLTQDENAHTQLITLDDDLTEDESIGTGDGSDTSPTLSDLAAVTNGLWCKGSMKPVVTATCSGVTRTVEIESDGTCTGYCSAGEIDVDTGEWAEDITWTTAPDNLSDITITYRDKPFSYAGNVATLTLADQVAHAFSATNTYVSGVVLGGDVVANVTDFTDASGIYDDATYPVQVSNDAAEEDTFTLTFTSGSAFSCSGVIAGSLGTGNTSSDFAPVNPATGTPYFTIDADGWEGSPSSGNTISFKTHAGVFALWWRQIVPALTDAAERNVVFIETTNE